MTVSRALFSSSSGEWETPLDLIDRLRAEFGIGIDLAATHENHKFPVYCTETGTFEVPAAGPTPQVVGPEDGLRADWLALRNRYACAAFCNPPYGREVRAWARHAVIGRSSQYPIVMLLPARTDTRWFHEWIYGDMYIDVRFLKGRLKFVGVCPGCGGRGTRSAWTQGELPAATEACQECSGSGKTRPAPAPFPSMIAVIR